MSKFEQSDPPWSEFELPPVHNLMVYTCGCSTAAYGGYSVGGPNSKPQDNLYICNVLQSSQLFILWNCFFFCLILKLMVYTCSFCLFVTLKDIVISVLSKYSFSDLLYQWGESPDSVRYTKNGCYFSQINLLFQVCFSSFFNFLSFPQEPHSTFASIHYYGYIYGSMYLWMYG